MNKVFQIDNLVIHIFSITCSNSIKSFITTVLVSVSVRVILIDHY